MKLMAFVFLLSLGNCLKAQDAHSATLFSYVYKIDSFNEYYPYEKIYLHFGNTIYFLGDMVWLKSHLVNAPRHISGNWSRTPYVELPTQKGDIITTQKYPRALYWNPDVHSDGQWYAGSIFTTTALASK